LRRDELDMGWLHIRLLGALGLVKIRRVAPQPALMEQSESTDIDKLRAIIVNRMHVLSHFTNSVTLPALRREVECLGHNANVILRKAKRLLSWQPEMLDAESQASLSDILEKHPRIRAILEYRNELKSLWEGAHSSNEKLLADFRTWCSRAEASGIQGMRDFVSYLQSFRAIPERAAT
jgi:stearoyl-CoA desaturase (delta-9 desaturase)